MDRPAGITGILLAAGESRRFGSNKLTTSLPGGVPLALASARNLLAAVSKVVAVVTKGDGQLSPLLAEAGCAIVEVAGARQGIGSSIAAGVSTALEARGWLIALADMPHIAPDTIDAIVAAVGRGAAAAAPRYRGERGHPVGFGAALRDELLALRGEGGARTILDRRPHEVLLIDVDDPGVLIDIDTPADLAASERSHSD